MEKRRGRACVFISFLIYLPADAGNTTPSPPRISACNRGSRGGAACFLHVWIIQEAGAGVWIWKGCEGTGQGMDAQIEENETFMILSFQVQKCMFINFISYIFLYCVTTYHPAPQENLILVFFYAKILKS